MELLQLRYFQTVALTGNISKAADILYVSQPNLSISLTRLEEELGFPLFERRRGRILLNENGKRFLGCVDEALGILDKGVENIRNQISQRQTLSLAFMMEEDELLTEFALAHPEIRIRYQNLSKESLTKALLDQELDLALTTIELFDLQLGFQKVHEGKSAAVLADTHPLAGRKALSYSDLFGQNLALDTTLVDMDLFRNATFKRGLEPTISHELRQLDVLTTLLRSGQFVSTFPIIKFKELAVHGQASHLCCIPMLETTPTVYWGVCWNQIAPLSEAGRKFLNFTRDYFLRIESQYAAMYPDSLV